MAKPRANTIPGRGRPLAIVAMLLAALVLTGILGWQSWQLQRSSAATADAVLRDYGLLVADEFGRRAAAELGYRGYYQLATRLAGVTEPLAMRASLGADPEISVAAGLARGFFVRKGASLETDLQNLSGDLEALLRKIGSKPAGDTAPFYSTRTASGREQVVYWLQSLPDGGSQVAGLIVDDAGIADHLGRVLDSGPLLPLSLADGQIGNDMLFVRVADPAGSALLESNPSFDSRLTVSKTAGAEYQGILEGFRIDVSLDPASAGLLVIGGLPESQLPVLMLVMAFVVVLMVTALWLFRREQALMKLRTDFVSQVSHELRTPLTQIRMFAETLLLDRTRNDDERRRSLEIIDRESQRLSHLVDNILRVSSISDAPQVDSRPQPLAPIVEDVCNLVSATMDSASISVRAEVSARARVDADALRQVLLNLLDNALKYGPPGQQVDVSLSLENGAVRLTVEDEGPGIPEPERSRVFAPFYRLLRERDTAISGTGIGLSVVADLVEAMGGSCRIEDSKSGGARVCLEFAESRDDA